MLQPFPVNPNYLTVIRGLLHMHWLATGGQFESPEADAIRDAMDGPWEGLSEVERKRIGGLSQDLNAILDTEATKPPPEMNPQAQEKLNQAYEARGRGEWDRALELLRRWGKHISPALASYLRGTIWRAAGDAETAAVFFEHASRLEPGNDNYQALLLRVLKTADPKGAAVRAEEILRNSDARTPLVVVCAADIVFGSTKGASEPDATSTYRRLIPILERTLARMRDMEDGDSPSLHCMVLSLLAVCHRRLGETSRAYEYYSRAIQLDPTNDAFLVARGVLMYGTTPQPPADLEQAVQLGSPKVWPYFYLAHYYLSNNRFEDCRLLCEQALHKQPTPRVKSDLYDFLAISQAELRYPEVVIRTAFENALRFDPSNARARRNLDRFEEALSSRAPQPRNWERPSESSLRLFGQEDVWADDALFTAQEPALVSIRT